MFDLGYVRRYEPFALVRLARQWDPRRGLACEVHVGAREPRVVADLERLVDTTGWELHERVAGPRRAALRPGRLGRGLEPAARPANASRSAIRRFASSIISPSNMAAPRASPVLARS